MFLLADRPINIWRLARYCVDTFFRTRRIQIFVITYLAYATLYATRKPFSVVKTDIQRNLDVSTDWLGAIDTCFLAAYAISQLMIPTLLIQFPHMSASTILLLLYGGSGLCSIIFGVASHPLLFCFLWVANGLFHAAVFPLLIVCLSPWFASNERGKVMGAWTTSQQTGAIAATALSAWMAAHLGWRAAFTIPGLFTAMFGLFIAWAMRGTYADGTSVHQSPLPIHESGTNENVELVIRVPSEETSAIAATHHSNSAGPTFYSTVEEKKARELVHLYDTPPALKSLEEVCSLDPKTQAVLKISQITDVKSVSCAYFCIKCIRYSLLFWLPYYLATELGYPNEVAGYTSIIFDVGGVVGGIGAGQIADRVFGGRRLYIAALACLCGMLSLVAFSYFAGSSKFVALSILAVIGTAIAAADSIIGASAASDICERAKCGGTAIGAVSGIINGCGSIGAMLQGYMTSRLTQLVGWPWFYMILALVSTVGGGFLFVPVVHERAAIRT